jgi:hypothetical protein
MTEPQFQGRCSRNKWQQKCMISATKGNASDTRSKTVAFLHMQMHRARQLDRNGVKWCTPELRQTDYWKTCLSDMQSRPSRSWMEHSRAQLEQHWHCMRIAVSGERRCR